jgi:hypothetical protein
MKQGIIGKTKVIKVEKRYEDIGGGDRYFQNPAQMRIAKTSARENCDTAIAQQTQNTNMVSGLHVGAGIDQQPHAVRVTAMRGGNQRRAFVLRAEIWPPRNQHTTVVNEKSEERKRRING